MWYQNSVSKQDSHWTPQWSEYQAILNQLSGLKKILFLLGL